MALWKKSSTVVTVALVWGVVSPMSPLAVGQALKETSTSVTHSCEVVKPAVLGTDHTLVVSPHSVVVRHPERVAPGEVFTIYVHPGAMTTGGRAAGRLSYELMFPAGATGLSATDTGNIVGYTIPDGAPATIERVTAGGTLAPEGPVARVSGGSLVRMNPNTITQLYAADQSGGITVGANQSFRLPEIAMKLRAPVDSAGTEVKGAFKAAGVSNGSKTDPSMNSLTGGQLSGLAGGRSNHFYCSSSANAASLSSTVVDSSLPRYIAQTSTVMTTADAHLPRSTPATRTAMLSANVSTDEELMSNVRAGLAAMSFTVRDKDTGHLVHTANGAIGTDGTASVSYTFPDLTGPGHRNDYEVTATYTGRENDIASSTSAPTNISVGYNEINAGVVLRSTNTQLPNGNVTVALSADLTMSRAFPANLSLQLYRNDQLHGSPIAIPSGGTTKTINNVLTETLAQEEDTKTYRYRAEVVPLIIGGVDRYAGGSAVPVAAIVTGTNPGSALPTGGEGSVSLEGFFRAPQLVWDWLSGSMGQAGTFSLGFAN